MHCNFDKTDVGSNMEVKIEKELVPQISPFDYLGSIIQENEKLTKMLNKEFKPGG